MAPSVKVRLEIEGAPQAVAAVRAFASQSKAAGREASEGFAGLSNALSGVTKLFAAYKVAQATVQLTQFTVATVKAAAEQKDLALALGTTIANFSSLSAVAKVTNTDQAKVVKGLGEMGDRIKDLRSGSPVAARAFGQLGLSAKDFATDDVVLNMVKIGDALERVARGGTKGALATDVLGKSGRALLPVFEKLNQIGGLEGATRLAKELGIFLDASTIATIDQIASTLQEIEARARGIALQFAKGFGPEALIALRGVQSVLIGSKPAAEGFGIAIGHLARGMAELVVHTVAWGTVLGDIFTGKFAKARTDFEFFDKLLKDMRDAKPELAKPFDDSVGGTTVEDEQARTAAAARRRKLEEEYGRLEVEKRQATIEALTAVNEAEYAQGLISLEEYFRRREDLVTRELQRQYADAQRRIAALPPGLERDVAIREAAVLQQRISAAVQENANQFEAARGKVRNFATELRDNLTGALTAFATSGVNSVRSLTDAFVQLGRAIASAVQVTAGQFLVQSALRFLSPQGRAAGGLITGPGTGTSDSIPAWVSSGEYIVPAHAVARPGALSMLEAMKRGSADLGSLRQNFGFHLRPRGFAEGGLVDGPGMGGASSATVGGTIQVGLDDGLVLRAIESPAGQRVLLKVMSRSPRAFGAAIRR